MIKCENCGAWYEETLRQCPYCGAENLELTEREYQGRIQDIEKKTRQLSSLPAQLVRLWGKRWGKVLLIAVMAVFVIGVVGAGVRAVSGYIANVQAPARQQEHLEALDLLVEAEDYEGIWDYMSENDLFGGPYEEYSNIYFASYPLYYVEECRGLIESYGAVWESTLGFALEEVSRGILDIDEMLETGSFVRGGDEVISSIREELLSFLTTDLGLSDADIETLYDLCAETEGSEDYEATRALFVEAGRASVENHGIRIASDEEEPGPAA